jgi:hypothetical protein
MRPLAFTIAQLVSTVTLALARISTVVTPLEARVVPTADSSAVACSADHSVVALGEALRLRVFVPEGGSDTVSQWIVDSGKLTRGTALQASWDLRDAPLGWHVAEARTEASGGRRATCRISIFVVAGGAIRSLGTGVPGRALLRSGRKEGEGYGLYTYLLLPAEPDDSTRPVYRTALGEIQRLLVELDSLERLSGRDGLNAVYLPVRRTPRSISSDSILRWYDYPRAQVLLAKLGRPRGRPGPILVSTRRPLSSDTLAHPYFVQDLSGVPPELLQLWIPEFLNQGAQERFLSNGALERFALRARTTISVLAKGLPAVIGATKEWRKTIADLLVLTK